MTELKKSIVALLRWSEKYTKTDMLYLVKGGFWLTLGQVAAALSTFILAIAFANLVSQETYGTYKYILSIAGMFAIFTLPGMITTISRASAQGNESVLHPATKAQVQFSLIGSIIILCVSGYYFYNGNIELSIAFLVIAASLPFVDPLTGYRAYLTGKRQFALQTKYFIGTQLVSVGTMVATLYLTNNLIFLLLAYFVPLILIHSALYKYTANKIPQCTDEKVMHDALSYGKHLTVMQILGTLMGQVDKILIWKFFGPVQLAIYTFALAIPEQLKGPIKGLSELAFPKFAVQTEEQIRDNTPALWRKVGVYALGFIGISILYILAAPFIFSLLFPQYMDSVIYSQVFMATSVCLITTIPMSAISAHRKIKIQYYLSVINPFLQTALFVICIPLFGVWGAILARLIMRVYSVISTYIFYHLAFRK